MSTSLTPSATSSVPSYGSHLLPPQGPSSSWPQGPGVPPPPSPGSLLPPVLPLKAALVPPSEHHDQSSSRFCLLNTLRAFLLLSDMACEAWAWSGLTTSSASLPCPLRSSHMASPGPPVSLPETCWCCLSFARSPPPPTPRFQRSAALQAPCCNTSPSCHVTFIRVII